MGRNFLQPYAEVYINVKFSEKDKAKKLGARWDPTEKSWYYPCDIEDYDKLLVQKTGDGITKDFKVTKIKSLYIGDEDLDDIIKRLNK